MKLLIVGGVAGGATCAARALRLDNSIDCTIIERSPDISFANCGLPYFIGGEIPRRDSLSLHTPQSLKKSTGVREIKVQSEVLSIDRTSKTVAVKNLLNGQLETLSYDKLVLSPGASPLVPPVPGINDRRIFTLRTLQDMDKIKALVSSNRCRRIAIIGAGFIGLEVAEQLQNLRKEVHLIERAPAVIPQADPEMSRFLHPVIRKSGIKLHTSDGLKAFHPTSAAITVELESGLRIESDAVVLSIGVRPLNALAKQAGLQLNSRGFIVVNDVMQTNDPDIYAVGDVIETKDLVFPERRATVALGNIANMQARVAADHLVTGKSIPYPGSLGTAIVRCFDHVLAMTGWTETRLAAENIPYETVAINANDHAGYFPAAAVLTVKICWDPTTGRILGGQVVGTRGIDKRIDVISMAIQGRLTIDDLTFSQLAYAPPFGTARDAVNVAAIFARNSRDGLVKNRKDYGKGRVLLDVRPADVREKDPIAGSRNVFWSDVPKAIQEGKLTKDEKYSVLCNWGRTAYFATRALQQAGIDAQRVDGGRRVDITRGDDSKPSSKL